MMKEKCIFLFSALMAMTMNYVNARTLHVTKGGLDTNAGTLKAPFASISKAASIALATDTVLIHEGVYREWVSPANSGINHSKRIVYMAAPGENVWIKGSEVVMGWKNDSKGIWKVEVPNTIFADFNPFAINVSGGWLQKGKSLHLGEVYIEG